MSAGPLVEKLRREKVTRMYEGDYINPNGPEAADTIDALVEALESLKALNQGTYDNDNLPPGQRNFAKLCIDKIDAALAKVTRNV